ncbi:MAG: TasA family protein [Candidatus Shapirobacteria bacterium]
MKKIVSSILLIVFILGLVSSSAYALFSSTATVSGLTFSTGSADLKISIDGNTWDTTFEPVSNYTNMAPGFLGSQEFYLKNTSLSNIGLNIFTKLIDNSPASNSSSWSVIGNKIIVSFQKYNGTTWIDLASGPISQWQTTGFEIDSISYGNSQKYQMKVSLNGIDNNDTGQTLSGLSFQFLGTQQ